MATVINNPTTDSSSGGVSWLLGAIILLVVAFMVLYYGLPAFRQIITVPVPSQTAPSTPNVNIPGKIDINVNNPNNPAPNPQTP